MRDRLSGGSGLARDAPAVGSLNTDVLCRDVIFRYSQPHANAAALSP
jgi:hypothetical protein